jgi:hypothetical protein
MLASNILKILEGNHNARDIIESLFEGRILQDPVHWCPALLMRSPTVYLFLSRGRRTAVITID